MIPLTLVALLAGCGPGGSGPGLNGGIPVGSSSSPAYWVDGYCSVSFKVQGEGNPVGFSSFGANNSTYEIAYKDIGTFEGDIITIPADSDIGDDFWTGIGTYTILETTTLTEENSRYFGAGVYNNCEDGTTCIPLCDNGQVWGDNINDKLEEYGGFLLELDSVGGSDETRAEPTFLLEGAWNGHDACKTTVAYNLNGDCSGLD